MKNIVRAGFTIVELIVVMFVLGVLVTIAVISYQNTQNRAVDATVLSDLDTLDGIQTQYGLANNSAGKPYYSLAPTDGSYPYIDNDLDFRPTRDNVIDIVIDSVDYCIRGYNTAGSLYTTLATAAIKESTSGVCATLSASSSAQVDSPL